MKTGRVRPTHALPACRPACSQVDAAAQVARGALTGSYESTRFKTKPEGASKLAAVHLLFAGGDAAADAAADHAAKLARGALLTR